MTTKEQGTAGLGEAIKHFTKEGKVVSIPLTGSKHYDLIVDDGESLAKIQVKTTTTKSKTGYTVDLRGAGNDAYNIDEVDYLFVLCGNGEVYLIPSYDLADVKSRVTLNSSKDKYKVAPTECFSTPYELSFWDKLVALFR